VAKCCWSNTTVHYFCRFWCVISPLQLVDKLQFFYIYLGVTISSDLRWERHVTIIYRQDTAKQQTACIKFTHRTISIFAPQGRLVAPIHVKFVMTKSHEGPLNHTKLQANRFTGVGTPPKLPLFGKESPHRGEPFDWLLQLLGAFISPTILLCNFTFEVIRFTGHGVTAQKPHVGHLPQIFLCTL